jgi:hypothetical protein
MEPFAIDELTDEMVREEKLVVEFLRRESMSLEVYRLPAGATDPQDPHTEDEVYYVVSGAAKIALVMKLMQLRRVMSSLSNARSSTTFSTLRRISSRWFSSRPHRTR